MLDVAVYQKDSITPQILLGIFYKLDFKCSKDTVLGLHAFWIQLVDFLLVFAHQFSKQEAILKVTWSKIIQYQERELNILLPFYPTLSIMSKY